MNVLNGIGNVGRDAEMRYTPNNEPVCSFNFALTSGYGDKQITTWLNCTVWGKRAETLAPMLIKGTKIGVTGELANRPYKAKDGTEKYSLELRVSDVTLLGKPHQGVAGNKKPDSNSDADFDDDLPPF